VCYILFSNCPNDSPICFDYTLPLSNNFILSAFVFPWQRLAKHVMQVHLNALQHEEGIEGELSLAVLKKFIAFCRS